MKQFIKVRKVGIGNMLDKHSWVAVLYLQHCNREAASRAKEEMMQQNLLTFALP
jgi:hypothetical protein